MGCVRKKCVAPYKGFSPCRLVFTRFGTHVKSRCELREYTVHSHSNTDAIDFNNFLKFVRYKFTT